MDGEKMSERELLIEEIIKDMEDLTDEELQEVIDYAATLHRPQTP